MKYQVRWEEQHTSIIEAENEIDAINKVNEGEGDESAEISSSFEAYPIPELD